MGCFAFGAGCWGLWCLVVLCLVRFWVVAGCPGGFSGVVLVVFGYLVGARLTASW